MSSLYFSWSAFNSGASACIRFIERVLAAVNGQNIPRKITVINTMSQAVTQRASDRAASSYTTAAPWRKRFQRPKK